MTSPWEHIPGQTPIDDISGLKLRHVRTTAELNAAEAENIRKAAAKYILVRPTRRSARFDVAWMKRLHTEMFGEVWTWAGQFRKRETNIGSRPHQIEVDLHGIVQDLGAWEKAGMPLLEQAVRLHHGTVRVHPFPNGNGRWSRMLANIWLRLHDGPLVVWPEATIGASSEVRDEYLRAVRLADKGDMAKLIALHERFTARDQ